MIGAGQGLAVDFDLALVGDGEGRRFEQLAVDLHAAGRDPALASRREQSRRAPAAWQSVRGRSLGGCRSQEGAEELRVALGDQKFGMPLHADAEAITRRLDASITPSGAVAFTTTPAGASAAAW